MTVKELSQDELFELKQNYLVKNNKQALVNVNDLVSDEEIYQAYEGIDFTPDDFFCNL